jgi:hypothetical protein
MTTPIKPSERLKPIKSRRTVLSTSRHEAAHAVIAEKLGIHVQRLHLAPPVDRAVVGACELDGRSMRKVGPFTMGLILMAGSVADNYWRSEAIGIVSGDDHAALAHMGANALDFRALYLACRPLVVKHRGAILRVSKALAKAGELSGNQVRELL